MKTRVAPVKIIIAEDLPLLREGLYCVLTQYPGLEVVGTTSHRPELLQLVRQHRPQVVLLDATLLDPEAGEALQLIHEITSCGKILTLWKKNDPGLLMGLIEAGVTGYLLKTTGKEELLGAIGKVLEGGTYYSKEITDWLIHDLSRASSHLPAPSTTPRLSPRERDVILLMCQEYSSKEIAARLNINSRSVESYRERIQKKVGAKNMIGIVLFAIKNGIYRLDEPVTSVEPPGKLR